MNQPDMDKIRAALDKRINAILTGEFRSVAQSLNDKCAFCGTFHRSGPCSYTAPTDPYAEK